MTLSLAALIIGAQTPVSRPPDVFIVTHKHATGADMVTVRMRKPNYPVDLFGKQCQALGKELGSDPRGVQIYEQAIGPTGLEGQTPTAAQPNMISAQFAVDGLVDEVGGHVNLQALVRAFAGGNPQFNNTAFDVILEGETPATATLQSYRYPSDPKSPPLVEVHADTVANPPAVEYTVLLGSVKPEDIVIPSSITEVPEISAPKAPSKGGSRLNWLAVALAVIGVGAGTVIIFLARRAQAKSPQTQ